MKDNKQKFQEVLDNLTEGIENNKRALEVLGELDDTDIEKLQLEIYNNLRESFNETVDEVLGEDYYNIYWNSSDVDRQTCKDITSKYKKAVKQMKMWRTIAMIVIAILSITIPPLIFLLMYI